MYFNNPLRLSAWASNTNSSHHNGSGNCRKIEACAYPGRSEVTRKWVQGLLALVPIGCRARVLVLVHKILAAPTWCLFLVARVPVVHLLESGVGTWLSSPGHTNFVCPDYGELDKYVNQTIFVFQKMAGPNIS